MLSPLALILMNAATAAALLHFSGKSPVSDPSPAPGPIPGPDPAPAPDPAPPPAPAPASTIGSLILAKKAADVALAAARRAAAEADATLLDSLRHVGDSAYIFDGTDVEVWEIAPDGTSFRVHRPADPTTPIAVPPVPPPAPTTT